MTLFKLNLLLWVTMCLTSCTTTPATTLLPVLSETFSPTQAYTVLPTLGGWSRYVGGPGTTFDGDLALFHGEVGVTAVFYVAPGSSNSLDDYVLRRRARIKQNSEIVAFDERRRFQAGSEFTTISISSYQVRYASTKGWSPIISGVIRGPTMTVEIFATGGRFPQNMELVEDLVAGVRFLIRKESVQ
jgi:hypothetical protein